MIRLLHLADLHLGWQPTFLGDKAAERQRERDGLLSRAVDLVLKKEPVDAVLIAGDLFETHTPPDGLIESVIKDLTRLVEAGVSVVTVPGNHDEITYADSVYRRHGPRWPGLLVQNPMPEKVAALDVKGTTLHVYSLAYTGGLTRLNPPLTDFPREDEPGVHVAVFHGSLDWPAGERSLPLSSAELGRAGYDYVALGHIHQPLERDVGEGKAVYAGATEGKAFGDPGTGSFCFVRLGPGRVQIERVPVPVRSIREERLDVTDLEDADAVAARIRERGDEEAIVRLRLVGGAPGPLSIDGLYERLRDAFYHLEIVDDTTLLDEGTIARLADEPTVRGRFVRRMREGVAEAETEEERALWEGALRRGLAALEGSGG